jgi:hypothetical protein
MPLCSRIRHEFERIATAKTHYIVRIFRINISIENVRGTTWIKADLINEIADWADGKTEWKEDLGERNDRPIDIDCEQNFSEDGSCMAHEEERSEPCQVTNLKIYRSYKVLK